MDRPRLCSGLHARRDRLVDDVAAQVGEVFAVVSRMASQAGIGATAPATSIRNTADDLVWHRVDVDGRTVVYGAGGSGPPVLFLHGWGLGSHAYKRALRRLTARGCRVVAPAMPGFGGSTGLPREMVSIDHYAAWAARFLAAAGVDEPAVVIGHSFGGGVGVQLAHDHPELVRYLVLLNAVGGATWDGRHGRSLADRPIHDWVLEFGRDFWPPRQGLELLSAMSQDVIGNLLRNPIVLYQAGQLARRADLTGELLDLRAAEIPVLALTSERDNIIPTAAFEALCSSLGAEGQIVAGGHSWVLADPEAFAEVLANIVEVEVEQHRATSAADASEAVRSSLRGTTIPRRVADVLVAEAPPLWLMSEQPTTLAADLSLCHPALAPAEVRAVAHPIPDTDTIRLTVVTHDRGGLLADTCAVLAHEGLSVESASAMTWPDLGLALHSLVVRPDHTLDTGDFDRLGTRLRAINVSPPVPTFEPMGRATVAVSGAPAQRATITVVAQDQVGLLWAITQWFADSGVSIEAVHATTELGVARDSFIVVGDCVPDALATVLSTPARTTRSRLRASA